MFLFAKQCCAITTVVLVIGIISDHQVSSLGKRSFGESCSIGGSILSLFSREREERTCDTDMGLVCTGTCGCPPGRVWDYNANDFESKFNDARGCAGAVGSPCIGTNRNQQCVSHAHCQFAFCRCKPGYKANGGHCVSTLEGDKTESGSNTKPQSTRPANPTTGGSSSGGGSIFFPELQDIFASIHSQQSNDRLPYDRFPTSGSNNFNDNNKFINDKFLSIDRFRNEPKRGSGSIRFEE